MDECRLAQRQRDNPQAEPDLLPERQVVPVSESAA
jgi:hypothetical protein